MRLSNTAINIFKQCARKYKHHYLDKLRSEMIQSAFHFGSAVDNALNVMLLQKKKKLTKQEKEEVKQDPLEVFEKTFKYVTIKKDIGPEDISSSQYMDYYKSDFNYQLLLPKDIIELQLYMAISGYIKLDEPTFLDEDDPKKLRTKFRDYLARTEIDINPEVLYQDLRDKEKDGGIELTDRCFINFCCWLSLLRKGELMIKCYENEILPKIKEVYSIQRRVNLPNGAGDTLIGVIDLECSFVEEEGKFTADNKTSITKYKKSDINENTQLPIYDEYTENGKAAYIVLYKKPKFIKYKECVSCDYQETGKKRICPECKSDLEITEVEPVIEWDIITDNINEEKKDLHFNEISVTLEEIKEFTKDEYFPKNLDSCFDYGKKCPYYDLCRGGSTKGLIKKGK